MAEDLGFRIGTVGDAELLQSFVGFNVRETPDLPKHGENRSEEVPAQGDKEGKDGGEEGRAAREEPVPSPQDINEQVRKKVKRRKRRSGCKREELYCDKDRAAAVNMGNRDIKQSLKMKRKEDRSKNLQIPEEAEPGTFLALGTYEMYRGDVHIAAGFITKALELNPGEKNALIARSRCYILMGQPENALADAETALTIDKNFLKAIYQKAEALYYLGDFEHSLMYYHRGLHIRPDHAGFKTGVNKAQKAIENAIGSSSVFSKLFAPKPSTGRKSKTSESPESSNSTGKPSSKGASAGSKGKGEKKNRLLRQLAPDKEYLDNLMKNPNLKCKFNEGDSNIYKTIEETVEYLNARQEFWRQQLPAHLK